MNIKRITRLLQLLQLLQCGTDANVEKLSAECRVNRRTIFRDLEALRKAGVPLIFDKYQQRYSIAGAYFLPPTSLTADEALSLVTIATEMGRPDRLPFLEAAKSAAIKLEDSLPLKLRQQLRLMRSIIHICPSQLTRLDQKHIFFQSFVDAILARRIVAMSYDTLIGETLQTQVSPYHLLFCRHSWYAVGHSSHEEKICTFDISRVLHLEVLKDKFVFPAGFRIRRYLGNAWEMRPEGGRDINVLVRFKPLIARGIAQIEWHRTQETTFLDDGALDFRVRVSGLEEIASWILAFGEQAEVLQPKRLRRMVAEKAWKMAELYNSSQANKE